MRPQGRKRSLIIFNLTAAKHLFAPTRSLQAGCSRSEIIMKKKSLSSIIIRGAILTAAFLSLASFSFAQKKTTKKPPVKNLPQVTQLDDAGLKKLLTPNNKPLLVNFWATWCDPCREEFPDLVKLDAEYKDKIDFITVSLDDLAEISREVPLFLSEMKATMPAYLLRSADESQTINAIAKDWSGGLPFTALYNEKGEIVYFKQGKVKLELLTTEIEKLIKVTQ